MSTDERFVGKSIPTSEFTSDTGEPDPAVVGALAAFAAGAGSRSAALAALSTSRLFVPVKAVLDTTEMTTSGHEVEKDSHMATVSIETPDGRRALLAFTSVGAMATWDSEARPVAARASVVAAAAVDEGADAVLIDVANEHRFVLDSDALTAISRGEQVGSPVSSPTIQKAVMEAVAPVARAYGCQFELSEPAGDADIRITLVNAEGLDVGVVLGEVSTALQGSEVLRAKLPRGLELGVRSA